MPHDLLTDAKWRIAAEGLDDPDPEGNWIILTSLFLTTNAVEAANTFELVSGVLKSCNDQETVSEIKTNLCFSDQDACEILKGIVAHMRPYDLIGGFTEFPVEIKAWLEQLYSSDPGHVTHILSQVEEFVKHSTTLCQKEQQP